MNAPNLISAKASVLSYDVVADKSDEKSSIISIMQNTAIW